MEGGKLQEHQTWAKNFRQMKKQGTNNLPQGRTSQLVTQCQVVSPDILYILATLYKFMYLGMYMDIHIYGYAYLFIYLVRHGYIHLYVFMNVCMYV